MSDDEFEPEGFVIQGITITRRMRPDGIETYAVEYQGDVGWLEGLGLRRQSFTTTSNANPIGATMTDAIEGTDEISDLVDWQLSRRSVIDNSMWTCHACRCRWQSGPMSCPECGERKRT